MVAVPTPLRCFDGSTAHGPSVSAGAPSTWHLEYSACPTIVPSVSVATIDNPSIQAARSFRNSSTIRASSGVGNAP